jgi:S1-C subfamily serine protease
MAGDYAINPLLIDASLTRSISHVPYFDVSKLASRLNVPHCSHNFRFNCRITYPSRIPLQLEAGDIIHQVNGHFIHDAADLRESLAQAQVSNPLVLQVEREGYLRYIAISRQP